MANRWEKVLLGKKWAYSGGASYAVYDKLPDSKKELELYMSHLPLAAASGKFMEVKFAAAKLMRQIAAKISKNLRNSLV